MMIIDCHAHHVAAPYNTRYLEWMKKSGRTDFGPVYLWNNPAFEEEQKRFEKMKTYGIDLSIITYSANIVQIVDALSESPEKRSSTVSDINDRMFSIAADSKGKLAATALIDPRLEKSALYEIERTAKQAVGLSVLAAYKEDGRICFLDDMRYEPFWQEAERLGKPVFIHFSNLWKINDPKVPLPGYMNDTLLYAGLGQLVEDALCVARLILGGLFDRHPNLKLIFGQLGGLYPYMLDRMEMLYGMYEKGALLQGLSVRNAEDPAHFLRNIKEYTDSIYADTHSMSPAAVSCAAEVLGADKLLYGSDYPITPDTWGMEHALDGLYKLNPQMQKQILESNARRLLGL